MTTTTTAGDSLNEALALAELYNQSGRDSRAFALGFIDGSRSRGNWVGGRDMLTEPYLAAYDAGFAAGDRIRPKCAWEV